MDQQSEKKARAPEIFNNPWLLMSVCEETHESLMCREFSDLCAVCFPAAEEKCSAVN